MPIACQYVHETLTKCGPNSVEKEVASALASGLIQSRRRRRGILRLGKLDVSAEFRILPCVPVVLVVAALNGQSGGFTGQASFL